MEHLGFWANFQKPETMSLSRLLLTSGVKLKGLMTQLLTSVFFWQCGI